MSNPFDKVTLDLNRQIILLEGKNSELTAEVERLNSSLDAKCVLHLDAEKSELRQQLAAAEEHNARLREALRDAYVELFHCDQQMTNTYDEDGEPMWHTGMTVTMALEGAKEILDTPASREALDAYVAERTLAIADQLQKERLQAITDFGQYQEAHEQIAILRKQRDLAVEALKTCGVNDGMNGPSQYFDEELVELAIKESEVK